MLAERRKTEPNRSHVKLRDRYNLESAQPHPAGLGSMQRSRNAFMALVAVEDPIADPNTGRKGRLLATVNRRVDILELERSHGRISDDAYCEGRLVQAIFEKARGPGGGAWFDGSRVDAERAKEIAIVRALDVARAIQARLDAIREILGMIDARIVEAVLRDRMGFADLAGSRGRAGRAGTAYFADRFRDALETLAEARGKR